MLLNPLPIYGLAAGVLALVVGLAMRSRSAQVTALVVYSFLRPIGLVGLPVWGSEDQRTKPS